MFDKCVFKDKEEKEAWRKTMKFEFVSSDESGMEDETEFYHRTTAMAVRKGNTFQNKLRDK